MRYLPALDDFRELARTYNMVPVYRRLTSDTITPVSAFCRIREGEWSILFESVVGGERVSRYSFIASDPYMRFEAFDRKVRITRGNLVEELTLDDPLRKLEELIGIYKAPQLEGLPKFTGGAIGYAGYDSVRYVEHLPNVPEDDRHLADLAFGFYDRMVIFDQINKTVAIVAHVHIEPGADIESAYRIACQRVDRLVERLQSGYADLQITDIEASRIRAKPDYTSNFTKEGFEAAVRTCIEYINAGDIFQVVLSQRLRKITKARPFDIYRALRILNPSPFMFYVRAGGTTLVGSSPEIMVRVDNGQTTIRPLAGTRPRGETPEEDERLAEELLADPKERAEHIMLVDLGRNDVGRVSKFGSVRLTDLLTVERYSHVMHLASTVTGQLDDGKSAFDALRSGLPAGTLSGAPKIRAMEIIDSLEPHKRGPYGGAVGYIDFTGNMDTCIALRTMVMVGQTAYIQAGAGIVADSIPEMEYLETMNKAMGLLRALELAELYL